MQIVITKRNKPYFWSSSNAFFTLVLLSVIVISQLSKILKHLFRTRTVVLTEVHAACFEESHLVWATAAEQRKRRPVCHNHGWDKASH